MSEFDSILLYSCIYWLEIILVKVFDKNKKKRIGLLFFGIVCIPTMLIMSLRINVGTDYLNYEYLFNYVRNSGWDFWNYSSGFSYEYGFLLYVKILSVFLSNKGIWAMIALSYNVLFYLFIREYFDDNRFSIVICYALFFAVLYLNGLNISRQIIAILISLNAIKYCTINLKKFVFLIMIACLFHYTAIVFLVIVMLWNYNKNIMISKKRQFLYLLIGIVFAVVWKKIYYLVSSFSLFYFLRKYDYALNKISGGNRTFILSIIIVVSIALFAKRFRRENKINDLYIYLMYISFIVNIIALNFKFVYRVSDYFSASILGLIPFIPSFFNKKSKIIANFLIVLFIYIYIIFVYFVAKNGEIIPYNYR